MNTFCHHCTPEYHSILFDISDFIRFDFILILFLHSNFCSVQNVRSELSDLYLIYLYIYYVLSYSLSGNRTGDENRRILPANVAVAQKHLTISHRSAVKIPEQNTHVVSSQLKNH